MECPKLEYRPIDNEFGQIWADADERCKNPRCIVHRIFWKYGRSIVQAINSHEKLVEALKENYEYTKYAGANKRINTIEYMDEFFTRGLSAQQIAKQALKEAKS